MRFKIIHYQSNLVRLGIMFGDDLFYKQCLILHRFKFCDLRKPFAS